MKAESKWIEKVRLKINDGRGHEIESDQPPAYGGENSAPTPLDLVVMGLAGCINVIFVMIAGKMRLKFESAWVEVEADKPKGAKTIEGAKAVLKIKSGEEEKKIKKCLDQALATCPVGVIFEKAGIKVNCELEIVK